MFLSALRLPLVSMVLGWLSVTSFRYGVMRPRSKVAQLVRPRRYLALQLAKTYEPDTIFALSSGPITKTGVAVIRLSGPRSSWCLQRLLRAGSKLPEPRHASLRKLFCPKSGELLDSALILWMPGPKSFTGEDIVELHVHGSRAVIVGMFEAFEYLDRNSLVDAENKINGPLDNAQPKSSIGSSSSGGGIRPAERGEFTRRAFDNGRLDLTEVEGLADLLEAETSLQRTQALRQMEGHLRSTFEAWRAELVRGLAHTEAVIDFGDDDREDDVNDSALDALMPRIGDLASAIQGHLLDGRSGELVREGVRIALVGAPNAGKSSLINALARRPAAIVSPIAGTTRDVVSVRLDLGGVPCVVSDTAGLRAAGEASDVVEVEGMARARTAFMEAQIRVFVIDASDKAAAAAGEGVFEGLLAESKIEEEDSSISGSKTGSGPVVLRVLNKADLMVAPSTPEPLSSPSSYPVSCVTGAGLAGLEAALAQSVQKLLADGSPLVNAGSVGPNPQEGVLITRERHRRHLQQCLRHLHRFLGREGRLPMDAAAEELRLATLELGKLTGRVDVDELLDVIFRDFCIGK